MRRGAFVLHCKNCDLQSVPPGTVADKGSDKRAQPPEYSFSYTGRKKEDFLPERVLPLTSVDKGANFAM